MKTPKKPLPCPVCGGPSDSPSHAELASLLRRVSQYLVPFRPASETEDYDRYRINRCDHDSDARITARVAVSIMSRRLEGMCIDCADKSIEGEEP